MLVTVAQAAALIFLAEIGDKTFFVAVLLSAKFNPLPVFVGCMLALALSTVLAALVGYVASGILDPIVLTFAAAFLFLGFAVWLLWEWYSYNDEESAEKEAEEEITSATTRGSYGSLDHTHSSSDTFRTSRELPWWRVIGLAFSMNFIGELGDKTQIAVAVQASTSNPFWVGIGALIGFALVTGIAVLFGKTIAKYLSPRVILLTAAAAFSFFGILALIQGIQLTRKTDVSENTHFLNLKTAVAVLLKSFAEVGSLWKSPLLSADVPVSGTSWSFHAVFGCGLLAGVLLALLVVLIWKFYMKRDNPKPQSGSGSQSSSSWEPLDPVPTLPPRIDSNPEYAPLTLHLFTHRCGWLVALMIVQSLSAEVLESFKVLLRDHPNIIFFLTMLVGAGGNSGAQSAGLAVRKMALRQNVKLSEQLLMGCKLAPALALVGIIRCTCFGGVSLVESGTIAAALAIIVLFAVLIGTALPLLLDRFRIDPAHSIATIQVLMDIFGVCIMCFMGVLFLDYVTAAPHAKL